ncbi:carbohydrate-binding domain-containing protein [Paenibacillus qinlingensis]|uniref:carbohydrate-binding domain-containing protein n=1 Tax=Paenibacillus qinlingensis TaxID=1837343 RepID=UPI001564C4C1|nr:carbohydrate-binding domain-containing protein [Paenibacillus qinlingensis]NQX62715.1 hypothetical protein [Paenibacillus qinlingensis]
MSTVLRKHVKRCAFLFLSASILIGMFATVQPAYAATTTADVTVNANIIGNKVSQLLVGGFTEDLNLSVDGGLYAEKVFNRSFEFGSLDKAPYNTPLTGWTQVNRGSGAGTITVENSSPLNTVNTHYLHVNVTAAGTGVGISNAGWFGMSVKASTTYNYSFFAKKGSDFNSSLTLAIEGANGTVYGSNTISSLTGDWVKYTGSLTSSTNDANAKLVLTANGTGNVYLDFISLFPDQTYKNRPNGARIDMGEAYEDLHLKFIRFPGGCIIHSSAYQYNWKDQLGPVETRKEYPNMWVTQDPREHITNGFGMFEWLQFIEDLGTVAVPVLPVGVTHISSALDPNSAALNQLVQDTLDFVEFANGSATSTWGAKRAAMGHPAPFNIEYLGLGNEEYDTPNARADITKVYNAVHQAYPSLKLIVTSGDSHSLYDFSAQLGAYETDAHYYFTRGSLGWIDFIYSYNREYPKVMIGEYGSNSRDATINDALDMAKDKTVFEKNGDILDMSAFTHLRRVIDFDNANVFKSNYHHVDKMWAENLADYNVNFRQSGDTNLMVVAGKDDETGDVILKLINNSANTINSNITLNGMTNISSSADVTYLKPKVEGNKDAKDDNYRNDGLGQSTDLNEVDFGTTTASIIGNLLNYSLVPYSFSVVRVHGNISTSDASTIYEVENLNGGATISNSRALTAEYQYLTGMNASNSNWSKADLKAAGEYVQYNNFNVAEAGTYNVKIGYKTGTTRAILQMAIDGINQGSSFDQYGTGGNFADLDMGTVTLSAGKHPVRFTATGKNASSTDYGGAIDYILLTPINSGPANFNNMPTGGAPLGWNTNTSVGTVTVQNIPSSADKSVLLNKTGTTTGSMTSLSKAFAPLSGTVVVEAKVRRESTSNLWCLPYVYSSNGTIAESIQFDNGNIKAYYNGGWQTVQSFTAGTWYTLKLVINTDTDKFDLFINGVQKVTQGTLRNAVSDIAKIEFYAADFNTGTTYVDVESEPYSTSGNFNSMPTGGAPLGWNVNTSVGTVTVQDVPSSSDKSVMLNKIGTATGSKTSLSKEFAPLAGEVVVEAKVRRESTSNLWCMPYVYSSDGTTLAETIQFDNGNIKAYNNGGWQTIQTFTAGTWYDLKLVIYTGTDKFDLYINGVQKVTQGTLRNAVSDIGKIEFYAADFNAGSTYVDIEREPYSN